MHKHFYIFRHGECPFNITGHIQGQSINSSLTQDGQAQAHSVGRRLSGRDIEVIISSPMRRTIETAQIVREYLSVPILIDRRFIEVNMGIVEGMHISLAEKRFAETYALWRNPDYQKKNIRFQGGESKEDVRTRIFKALDYYAYQTHYNSLAISAHGIMLSQTLLNFNIRESNIQNGSIVHIGCTGQDWQYHGFVEE